MAAPDALDDVQVMEASGVRDGIAALAALVDADAVVWGLVDCHDAGSARRAAGLDMMPQLTQKAHTVTDNAVRQAAIHLRQLIPPDSDVQHEYAAYVGSLQALASAGVGVPGTMVHSLPQELTTKFATAVANVRHPLIPRGALCP